LKIIFIIHSIKIICDLLFYFGSGILLTLVRSEVKNRKLKILDYSSNNELEYHLHNDEVNDKHFAFIVELGNVNPAEMVSATSVVERGHSTVIRPNVQSSSSWILLSHIRIKMKETRKTEWKILL
jgi:hypothetical protein